MKCTICCPYGTIGRSLFIFDIHLPKPEVLCKLFEENKGCITMAQSNKFIPKTKHIVIKYYHFMRLVKKK